MKSRQLCSRGVLRALAVFAVAWLVAGCGDDSKLNKVTHIIILMQENHSFDNYFGALAYAPGGPYHSPQSNNPAPGQKPGCAQGDHQCVDGLSCVANADGTLTCSNSNLDDDGSTAYAFHNPSRCVVPDLDHGWADTHKEINFVNPSQTFLESFNDGFVRINDITEQPDGGVESPTDDPTMGFYTQDDLSSYYNMAENFAIDDRYFASVPGPTFPNRSYLMAATSFGHLTTAEFFPPPGNYKPQTGTIFDLLDQNGITWADYFQDLPLSFIFRPVTDPHVLPQSMFFSQLANAPETLPQVIFMDPSLGAAGVATENDEHPPTDIQRGQAYVSKTISAIRNSAIWSSTIVFITYDEHGGFYDHVNPPIAMQGGIRTPDGVAPGQCADLSNLPASLQPGGGAQCSTNPSDNSLQDAEALCPALTSNPTGPYPDACASFDQLGLRVPLIAVSPFSKPHYVSHTIGDHASLLALIERRFLTIDGSRLYLTQRDRYANTLEDMFDFDASPSLNTPVVTAPPPAVDCTP